MSKMVTLVCQHGGHEWQRESQRGRRPLYCPEHAAAHAAPTLSADAITTGHVSVPKVTIDPAAVNKAFAEYEKAFATANRTNKLSDWHIADVAQSRAIGMSARARLSA